MWAWALQQSPRGAISTLTHGSIRDVHASNGQSQAVTATALIIEGLSHIWQVIWKWVWQLRLSGITTVNSKVKQKFDNMRNLSAKY